MRLRPILASMLAGGVAVAGLAFGAEEPTMIEVTPPGGAEDAGPAIRAAIAAALEPGASRHVRLAPGLYRVGRDPGTPDHIRVAFHIRGVEGLVVEGAGDGSTEIVITDPRAGGFFVEGSSDVTIKGLTIDYDPVPFTQGDVLSVDSEGGFFTMRVDDGFPLLDEPMFTEAPRPFGTFGVLWDREARRLKRDASDFLFMGDWTPTEDPRVWRMHVAPESHYRGGEVEPGDTFVQLARGGWGGAFFAHQSRRVVIEDCAIYTSPGLAIGAVATDALGVHGVTVEARPGTARLLSAVADGVHVQGAGIGPRITGSRFAHMADDGINIYSVCPLITRVEGENTIITTTSSNLKAGDDVMIFDPNEGRSRLRAQVLEAALFDDGGEQRLRVRLDQPIPEVATGDTPATADHLYNLSRTGGGAAIQGNTFQDHRRYGIMFKGPDALIEGNTFSGLGANAIVVGNDPDWPEGALGSHIRIVGNSVRDIGISSHYSEVPSGAAITVHAKARRRGGIAAERLVCDVTITGNNIVNPPSAGIFLGAVEGFEISGNTIAYEGDAARLPREAAGIVGVNVDDGTITGNTIRSSRAEITEGIDLHSDENGARVTVESNSISLKAK